MTISSQTARTGPYSGNGSTTVFAYDFRILDQTHIVVTLKNAANVETVQTLTTNYTVSGVGTSTGGNITMVVAPASGEQLTFSRAVPQTQEVDLANRGGVQPEILEAAYDKLTQLSQDKVELLNRMPRFPVSSALTDIELPLTLTANAVLAVNSAGTAFTNGPTSAQISSAQSYATAAEAALDEFTDLYLGAKASDPTLDNDGNALQDGALYFDTTDNVMKVYDLGTTTWKRTTPTTGEQANIDTVSGIAANVTTVAGISADVTTVAADGTDIGTVAGISADVTTVAGISADVTTVAANVTDVTNFADVYIGPSASDPTQRADTSALQAGDLYFNTTSNVMKVYTGSAWINATLVAADVLQVANNLSDLDNTGTARTNLGVAIGSDVQAYDADTAKTDVTQTFTISQRGTITTDNDLSFDLNATNNFKCTPSGTGTLTFTNHTAGQSGNILLDNSGGHAISLAATTKGDANLATTISTAGTYWLSYYDDGTNAYVVTSAVFA